MGVHWGARMAPAKMKAGAAEKSEEPVVRVATASLISIETVMRASSAQGGAGRWASRRKGAAAPAAIRHHSAV